MITPAFGLTATERVLPKLALDFTTASLDSRVTFTRTTDATHPATYVNSSGFITAAANNEWRRDFDPVTLECRGRLIEESRVNLFLYSEQFQQADWVKSSVTVDNDAVASPDGTTNADKIILDSGVASVSGVIRQQITKAASAITYTCSFYAKAGEFNSVRVIFRDTASSANFVQAYFNLNLGTVSTAANAGGTYTNPSASITNAGNGWYRCVLTGTTGANTTTDMRVLQYNNGNSSVTGDGTSGLYVWGAQLEAGAFATSYIPTTTTALTRNADVATMTGTNFSDWFNANEGTFQSQYNEFATGSVNSMIVSASNGTTNELIQHYLSNSDTPTYSVLVGGSSQCSITRTAVSRNAIHKSSFAYKLNNFALASDGSNVGADTSGNVPSGINSLNIGHRLQSSFFNGWIQKLKYWPYSLTNAEIQATSK